MGFKSRAWRLEPRGSKAASHARPHTTTITTPAQAGNGGRWAADLVAVVLQVEERAAEALFLQEPPGYRLVELLSLLL